MNSTNARNLREELGGRSDPDFEIQMLPGWVRRTPDESDLRSWDVAIKQKFMALHRPDLYARSRSLLQRTHEIMRQQEVISYYVPGNDEESVVRLPGSIVAAVRRPPPGHTLDQLVQDVISDYGATPLFGNKRFVRFELDEKVRVEGGSIAQKSIYYVTPVPGTYRRRALQFTATLGRPIEVAPDDERVEAMVAAFDLCVSTLRWVRSS